jgi:thiosulfate/3-mercaptopyruvate sulfurtransferase
MKLSPIIEVHELLEIYKNPNVLIFDVRNCLDAKSKYECEHLEGAIFIDLNTQLSESNGDISVGGRHPLPKIERFATTLRELGISSNSHIVIYDDKYGSNAAARFWWMLKSIGHQKIQVLNGGLNHAKENNFPLSSKADYPNRASKDYKFSQWKLATAEIYQVENASQNPNYLIVDVRDKERYHGKIEPIDLIAGHIPGSINIPFTDNLDQNGLFKNPKTLKKMYDAIFGLMENENIIVHCGSGVTACHSLLALDYADIEIPKLYVGSWSEWSRNNKEIELS